MLPNQNLESKRGEKKSISKKKLKIFLGEKTDIFLFFAFVQNILTKGKLLQFVFFSSFAK
jgi:hypothetical protein